VPWIALQFIDNAVGSARPEATSQWDLTLSPRHCHGSFESDQQQAEFRITAHG
jgi:hypothetical protein